MRLHDPGNLLQRWIILRRLEHSQLTAVGRTGKPRQLRCSLIAGDGLVPCELVIGRVGVKGNPDESDPLLVAVRDAPAANVEAAEVEAKAKPRSQLGAVQAITRRLDLITAVARLLLENEGYSESRTLQRCARLIARELTAWVIVDMDRGHRVRRQFVAGPDDPRLTELSSALAAVDPPPGSVPFTVHDSGHPALVAHAEDVRAHLREHGLTDRTLMTVPGRQDDRNAGAFIATARMDFRGQTAPRAAQSLCGLSAVFF